MTFSKAFARDFLFILSFFLFLYLPSCSSAKPTFVGVSEPFSSREKPLILLDPGHGGLNLGAKTAVPYTEEKRLTLTLALLTKRYLHQLGYRVLLTRYRDVFIPLKHRVKVANQSHGEVFVSLHLNSCPNKGIQGIEIYYWNAPKNGKREIASKKLAEKVLSQVLKRTSAISRGVRKGKFLVLRETEMPAILIEGGFMTHQEELHHLRQKKYQENLAKGIAEGIDAFLRR